jgi:hypothetical protein
VIEFNTIFFNGKINIYSFALEKKTSLQKPYKVLNEVINKLELCQKKNPLILILIVSHNYVMKFNLISLAAESNHKYF